MSTPYATETTPLLEPTASTTTPPPTSHHDAEAVPPPAHSTPLPFRIAATMFSFTVTGLFNASIGVLLPILAQHYHLTDFHVSTIFLCGPIGYVLASPFNASIHALLGQRGIAILGPLLHTLAALAIATHPPFPLVLLAFVVNAMGVGMVDGSWCAWAGGLERANVVSGLLHGSYSAGAAVGPFACWRFLRDLGSWAEWYRVLAAASLCEMVVLATAFWYEDAERYRRSSRHVVLEPSGTSSKAIFRRRATWFSAAYFLTYVGIETAISGWVVSFMMRARHAPGDVAALSSTGFWAGMAVGRLTLGYATDGIGVRRAATIYLSCAVVLLLAFALVESPTVSVVTIACAGFVMGPMFPSGVVVLSGLLPKELHVAAVSFIASVGQIGGAALPFGIGAAVEGLGIGVFRWIICIFACVALGVWVVFSRLKAGRVDRQVGE